eukprot:15481153-Alexandrium_andersonii.AAC.1
MARTSRASVGATAATRAGAPSPPPTTRRTPSAHSGFCPHRRGRPVKRRADAKSRPSSRHGSPKSLSQE